MRSHVRPTRSPRAAARRAALTIALAAASIAVPGAFLAPAEAAGAAASGAASSPVTLPAGVIYRINGQDISRERFSTELDAVLGESYRDTFISHVLIDQKAKALGVEVSSEEVATAAQASVDQVLRERFGGEMSRMQDALKERGMTVDGWKARLNVDSRYDLLLDKLIRKDRTVSDETLTRLFEERYGVGGTQIRVRHILKNVSVAASSDYTLQMFDAEKPKIEADAKARADEALKNIRGGQTFESVMAVYSDDPRKSQGGTMTAWKGRYGADFDEAVSKLQKNQVSDAIKGTDGYRIVQCTDILETDQVHAAHILVATGARAKGRTDAEAKTKAEGLLAQIKAGADFGQLAKDNSDDPGSATRGGDLGFFGRRAMVQQFEDVAFSLEPGQLSGIVQTNFGYHIIKVIEKRKSEDRVLRQIFISTQFVVVKDHKLRPAIEAKARGELEAALKQIQAPGGSFAEVAKTASDDLATRADGGLLKNYRQGLYGGDFDTTVDSMKKGDPPRIVSDAAGNLHLVVIDDIQKTDFASVKAVLLNEEMRRPPTPQEKADYTAALRTAATIVP